MANKPMKSIILPGLDDTYTFAQIDNTLTQTGQAADAKKTGDEISQLKADLSELETDIETGNLTAGTAKQLLSDNGMTDKSPYLFRAMPTGAGDREEPVVVGGSVVWNQLVQNGNFSDGTDGWGAEAANTTLSVSDGVATLTLSSGTSGLSSPALKWLSAPQAVVGHKYLIAFDAKTNNANLQGIYLRSNAIDNIYLSGLTTSFNRFVIIASAKAVNNIFFYLGPSVAEVLQVNDSLSFRNIICSDLTADFGTAIADYVFSLGSTEGLAYLRKYGFFTQDYYHHSEPTFKHVGGLVSHKMVGFNQWDEEWELGYYDNNGEIVPSNSRWRSKNDILILPNTTYYAYSGANKYLYIQLCASDGSIISRINIRNNTFITPQNAYIMRFSVGTEYGTTYNHDICINLSDPAKNGTYEPYKEYIYPLDSDVVLRGYPKLDASNNLYFDGDTYKPDGTVTRRCGIVDLGTLTWSYESANQRFNAYGVPSINASETNLKCPIYTVGATATENMTMQVTSSKALYIKNETYSDATTFKTAMSGVYLLYPLATPTTESADPYAPLQLADPYGTEEWVLADGAFPMPVGQETFYPENLRAKIEGLPWNFANLIAPTETTYTASRAYTAGQLFIVDNILYQATTSIASGGTITPGTNCTATTLAEVISAL